MVMRSSTLFLAINTTSIVIATVFSKSLALAFVRFLRKRPTSNVRRDVEHEYLNLVHSDFPQAFVALPFSKHVAMQRQSTRVV